MHLHGSAIRDAKHLACVWLIVLSVSPTIAQQKTSNLDAAKSAMTSGLAAMHAGDLTQARLDFLKVVKLAPTIEPGHAALGTVLLSLNDFSAAERELTTANHLDPTDLSTLLNLGRTQVALGKNDAAVASFQSAASAPNAIAFSAEETIAYATALTATKHLTEAIQLLQRALAVPPESAALNDALGTLLAQSGDIQQALPSFEHAIALEPALLSARLHLSAALLSLGRADDAIPHAEIAVATMPNNFSAQLQLGRALSAAHRDAEALQHLHRAAELSAAPQEPEALYALALALQASGDPKTALPIFAMALATPMPSVVRGSALTNYALAKVQTGDANGALPLYAQALAAGPDTATLREDYGVAYLQKADLDNALAQFRAGIGLEPDNAHLHYDLGLAYKLKDNLDVAVPEFERAAALDPSLPDPAYTLGVIYMQQGHYPESITNLRRATQLQPANGDAWALLGTVLKDSDQPDAAVDALRHAIELEPDQPGLHIQLAAIDSQAGRTAEAAAERKIAADLSRAAVTRQHADFALKSGRALLEQGKLAEAIFQLMTAAKADPTLSEPHRLLAEAYTRQGKAAEAALERKQALAPIH
jgi:protein O-GlcNAc transferase